ncbi:MAG: hypothetical protein QNL68_08725 [Akkermansiaceae bacterium]
MKPFLLIALLPTLAGAENILLVSNNNTNSQGLFDFLTTEGHTITRDPRQAGPLASDVTNFDIVIVTRATNSGDYANDANEAAAWNSLSIPIINFNAYLYRASRWGWTTTEGLTATSTSGLDKIAAAPITALGKPAPRSQTRMPTDTTTSLKAIPAPIPTALTPTATPSLMTPNSSPTKPTRLTRLTLPACPPRDKWTVSTSTSPREVAP